jgi:hypothetical protein
MEGGWEMKKVTCLSRKHAIVASVFERWTAVRWIAQGSIRESHQRWRASRKVIRDLMRHRMKMLE